MKHALLIPAAATLLLSACKDETISGYADTSVSWTLVEMNGKPFPANATISFPEKGRIAGSGPCNGYSASQTLPYPWFKTGPILSTKRVCADLNAETMFFAALGDMSIAEASGNILILSNEAGREMVFKAAPH